MMGLTVNPRRLVSVGPPNLELDGHDIVNLAWAAITWNASGTFRDIMMTQYELNRKAVGGPAWSSELIERIDEILAVIDVEH